MLARTLLTVVAIALTSALPCAAASAVNPGEWQITSTTEMSGMPMDVPPQTMTFTNCVTSDQPVPAQPEKQKECKLSDLKTEGQTVTWTIECNGEQGKMKGFGRIYYEGDSMTGEQTMDVSAGEGMSFKVLMHMTGKRLGPCKEKK
jgi:hypothetical protein